MKNLKLFIFVVLFIAGCAERNHKIEIVPNYDAEYKPASELNIVPKISSGNEFLQSQEFINQVEEIRKKDSINFPGTFIYTLFVNEEGTIDKVKIKSRMPIKEIDDIILKKLESIKFTQQTIDEKKFKFQYGWRVELAKSAAELECVLNADEMPFPVDGLSAIGKNVVYPETAKNAGITGKVLVKAIVDEKGDIINTEIVKGVNAELDKAAIEAIRKTKFKPGMLKGKTVKTIITIPISFVLQ